MSSERRVAMLPSRAERRKAETQLQAVLVGSDVLAILLAVLLAYALRFDSALVNLVPVTLGRPPIVLYAGAGLVVAFVWVPLFSAMGLYRPRHALDPVTQFDLALRGVAAGTFVVFALTFFYRGASFSRLVLPMACVLALFLVPLLRVWIGGWFAQRVVPLTPVAVVGSGLAAAHLARGLGIRRLPGIDFRGLYSDTPAPSGVPLLGVVDDLVAALDERDAGGGERVGAAALGRVYVALAPGETRHLSRLLEGLVDSRTEVAWVPDFTGVAPGRLRFEEFVGVPVLPLGDFPLLGWNGAVKRTMDVALSSIGLVLLAPVMLGVGLVVQLSSRGPVLYRQVRVGRDGRRFAMLKFRSMRVDAEVETGPTRTARGDARVTRVGRWLRRTSLDELPQLWNVLRGEMSLVGPRPERPALIGELVSEIPDYPKRHRVKSGMTGYAQVRGLRGADTSMRERILCDLYYIENWSLSLDLRILVRTVLGLFREPNAY